ncbi:MAG: hypothetical protein ACI86M_002959 [Saprospiraceae bacterium]|jgi:hypothetical protein
MDTSLIYFSISDLKIVTARHILTEAGIESFTIDKKDSVYAGILGGKIELYVRKDQEGEAKKILEESGVLDD